MRIYTVWADGKMSDMVERILGNVIGVLIAIVIMRLLGIVVSITFP